IHASARPQLSTAPSYTVSIPEGSQLIMSVSKKSDCQFGILIQPPSQHTSHSSTREPIVECSYRSRQSSSGLFAVEIAPFRELWDPIRTNGVPPMGEGSANRSRLTIDRPDPVPPHRL